MSILIYLVNLTADGVCCYGNGSCRNSMVLQTRWSHGGKIEGCTSDAHRDGANTYSLFYPRFFNLALLLRGGFLNWALSRTFLLSELAKPDK